MFHLPIRVFGGIFSGLLLAAVAPAAVFTVTTTNDAGAGSLREAILSANLSPAQDTIQFNLPRSGVQTIAPLTALPEVTNSVVINGYTQPGSQPNTLAWDNNANLQIRLDGVRLTNSYAPALLLRAGNCVVRGLIIVRFPYGIQIDSGGGNVIAGNWIGLDWDNIARGMAWDGVTVTCPVFASAMHNTIGGPNPADANIISGNREGITFSPGNAANNTVMGNFIGTDRSGRLPRGNLFSGVRVQTATNITVTGNVLAACTGAGGSGVSLLSTTGCVIKRNRIGLGADLATDLGNWSHGVFAQSVTGLVIGGTSSADRNYIGCNRGSGIFLQGCTAVTVEYNRIGTGAEGGEVLGNAQAGVHFTSSSTNRLRHNEILFNGGDGVSIVSGAANEVFLNAFHDNAGLAIDLNNDGLTPNDFADGDGGANDLQNFPILTNASFSSGQVTIDGILDTVPLRACRVEFYGADPWDPLGIPEGGVYLGAVSLVTDVTGFASIQFSGTTGGWTPVWVTAIAIDPAGNTSEFSPGVAVFSVPPPPALSLQGAGGSATLSWPVAAGYELQAATSLAAEAWGMATNTVLTSGGTNYVVLPSLSAKPREFFRLIRARP